MLHKCRFVCFSTCWDVAEREKKDEPRHLGDSRPGKEVVCLSMGNKGEEGPGPWTLLTKPYFSVTSPKASPAHSGSGVGTDT